MRFRYPTRPRLSGSYELRPASWLTCSWTLGRLGKSIHRQQLIGTMNHSMGTIDLTEQHIAWQFVCSGFGCLHRPRAEWAVLGEEPSQQLPEHV
jgi:hypothetical protein